MHSFLVGLAQSILGGFVVVVLGYLLLDHWLRLKDASDHRQALDAQRDANRTVVLESVLSELEGAAGALHTFSDAVAEGDVPFPGFDMTGWPLVSQAMVFHHSPS